MSEKIIPTEYFSNVAVNVDLIPDELLELVAKAATLCLVKSGFTGIHYEVDVLKENMKIIQDFEISHGAHRPNFYSRKGTLKNFE